MSAGFRNRMRDSEDDGWVYNWFCCDHVDYEINPRRRDIGYHNIFDHYRQATLDLAQSETDFTSTTIPTISAATPIDARLTGGHPPTASTRSSPGG